MILRSPTENENGDLRHAGMDGRHPGLQDASGDIHVGLDSSTPCWNDGIEESTKTDRDPPRLLFSKEDTKITKKDNLRKERKIENQKKSKAFVYFVRFV